jgi:hypothetical protein
MTHELAQTILILIGAAIIPIGLIILLGLQP